jgi:hypothetical protein
MAGATACQKFIKEHKAQASQLQQEHFFNRYQLATDLQDPVKCARIKEIIKQEEQQNEWQKIVRATGNQQTGAANLVQLMVRDVVVNIVEAKAMNEEIQWVTEWRFDLAQSAPITLLSLRQLIGFCASTQFANDLLQGKVPILLDINDTTVELIKEMQWLWVCLEPSHSLVNITPAVYQSYWGGMNEKISLALSKIHFWHWKVWRHGMAGAVGMYPTQPALQVWRSTIKMG